MSPNSNPASPQPKHTEPPLLPPPHTHGQSQPPLLEIIPYDAELEIKWRKIKDSLYAILTDAQNNQLRTVPSKWQNIYSDIAYLLHHDDTQRKRKVYERIRSYIREVVSIQLDHLRPLQGTTLLFEYVERWNSTRRYIRFVKSVMPHLKRWLNDQQNIRKDDPVRPLDKLLMFFWREDLLSQLCSVVETALGLIDDDRRGIAISHNIVRGVVDNFVEIGSAEVYSDDESDPVHEPADSSTPNSSSSKDNFFLLDDNLVPPRRNARFKQVPADDSQKLQLYLQVFENGYVERAEKFYREEGQKALNSRSHTDINSFLKMIMDRLDDEEKRTTLLLHQTSKDRVRNVVEEQLIGTHKHFLRDEAQRMIRETDEDGLRLVTNLLSRIDDGLVPVRQFLCEHIRNRGINIIKDYVASLSDKDNIRHDTSIVNKLISLYISQSRMVKRCFRDTNDTMSFVEKGMRLIVNHPQQEFSMPVLLAHYIDRFMRHSSIQDPNLIKFSKVISEELDAIPNCTTQTLLSLNQKNNQPSCPGQRQGNVLLLPIKKATTERHLRQSSVALNEIRGISEIGKLCQRASSTSSKPTSSIANQKFDSILEKDFETVRSRYMDEVIRFLMFIESKDVYYNHHREFFAKRLLSGYNEKLEIELINKIRDEMGTTYVGRLSGMLKDMNTDKEMRKDFGMYLKKRRIVSKTRRQTGKCDNPKDMEINDITFPYRVHVLNAQHWPKVAALNLKLSNPFEACNKIFQKFYAFVKETRKLTWVHSMSTVQLQGSWDSGTYTLNLSLTQASVLLLFNDRNQITLEDASKKLNIATSELVNQIRPLIVSNKCKLLELKKPSAFDNAADSPKRECEPLRKRLLNEAWVERPHKRQRTSDKIVEKTKEEVHNNESEVLDATEGNADQPFEEDRNSIICLNLNFSSVLKEIMVPARIVKFTNKYTPPEKSSNVVVERGTQIDATIVRIMKATKRVTHDMLCAEVSEKLSKIFMPEPKLIKERIQRLIDQDYISRDEQDKSVYVYET